ncbi:bifunctional diguanylate cyclase/phosphodiesterase [Hahella ganghwensis]|uniref:bifunctional diguanylate cyclase/phosphodiesterase n=1 Tax=Hahella ganghwensis TaxID=286420 RepID=UPI0003689D56|nr:EAL domain-containing protein [Hahella ganghwensis]
MSDNIPMQFADESDEDNAGRSEKSWQILIVDDDKDVHESTVFALRNARILGRKLVFDHAYTAAEAMEILHQRQDYAVILLDVVMESEHAGLELVRIIRQDMEITASRIILRTGQPGYAPETEAIREYDINDYKNKAELTQARLYTTLTASIRTYSQIVALDASKQGLEMIVKASSELMSLRGFHEFASGIITQITALLGIVGDSLVCLRSFADQKNNHQSVDEEERHFTVIAASGRFGHSMNCLLKDIDDNEMRRLLMEAVYRQSHMMTEKASALYFANGSGDDMLVYVEIYRPLEETEKQLLEVFSVNISICLDNVVMVERLHRYAYYDSLLGLPNRLYFASQVDEAINKGLESLRIVLLDIDGFSEINDTIGSNLGDALLKKVGERLCAWFGQKVLVTRMAGDQFGLLGQEEELSPENVKAVFLEPFVIDGNEQMMSISQGCLSLAESGNSANEAIKRASIALKRAKETVRGDSVEFTREMEIATQRRVKLLQSLRKAFDFRNLFLAYQPQVSLVDGTIVGMEALMRWRTESGSMVPPDAFIPTAETSGLIVPLGEWAFAQAIDELVRNGEKFGLQARMGVNVSQVQFRHPGFVASFASILEKSGVDPKLVELEITESVTMLDQEKVKKTLNQLKSLGLTIAIDDFGTGFSSLSYLQELNVDRLKIDKSFVSKLSPEKQSRSIPEMIIRLGQQFGLEVIAEGVETPDQADLLLHMGCPEAQGYLYARPMDSSGVERWIEQHLHKG